MKITRKFIITNVIVTLLAMTLLAVLIISRINSYTLENIKDDLISSNEIISTKLESGEKIAEIHFKQTSSTNFVYAYIYDIDNDNIIASVKNPKGNFDKRIVVNKASEADSGNFISINTNGMDLLAYPVDIKFNDNNYTVITAIKNNDVNKIANEIISVLLYSILITGILIIIILSIVSRKILKPINPIIKSIKAFSTKKFNKLIKVDTKDEFHLLAEELNKMAKTLQSTDSEQKKFYEDYSHDLKTPITVISGYAEGVKSGIIHNQEEALNLIIDECQNLKKQIENMIYLSKLETINETIEFKPINLNELLSQTVTSVESLIIINDIDVDFNISNDITIYGDKDMLKKAFTNIISNALKHTKDKLVITSSNNKKTIIIKVTDNGRGFTPELLDDPFSRNKLESYDGSNIGLSIVKKIIDKHNGQVKLSNIDSGAVCEVILSIKQ